MTSCPPVTQHPKQVQPKSESGIQHKVEDPPAGKKKKWKPVPIADLGFNMSLFPRPCRPEMIDPEEEDRILRTIERDLSAREETLEKCRNLDVQDFPVSEENVSKCAKVLRRDRDRKVRKAARQVKDKHCYTLKNNKGRTKLYIHHRLFKLINLEEKRLYLHLPKLKKNDSTINKNNNSTTETKSRFKTSDSSVNRRPAPVQNLRHALAETNASRDLATDLISSLINIQHRELTPEDYEVLLRLDDTVAPRTINKSVLSCFKTDTVSAETAGDICAVCMDPYIVGENRKFLPCRHVFHCECIDMWLENSSRICPIDGLPVDA